MEIQTFLELGQLLGGAVTMVTANLGPRLSRGETIPRLEIEKEIQRAFQTLSKDNAEEWAAVHLGPSPPRKET